MESDSGEPVFIAHDTSPAMAINISADDNREGWRVASVAFVVAVFGWGLGFYGVAVYVPALHEARGWPIAAVSTAVTAHYLVSAALIACLPAAYRRLGVARVTVIGAALAACGAMAWASAREPWQLVPAVLLSGAGWSAMSGAALNAMVAPWFDRDRPRAMGFAFNGASAGGLLLTPLWAVLIGHLGLPAAAFMMAAATALVVCPLAARFLAPLPSITAAPAAAARPSSRRALLGQRAFLTLSVAFALGLFAQIGLVTHLIARLQPLFGTELAALALSLVTICAIAGRTLLGRLIGDRDRRRVAAGNLLLQAAGTVLLTASDGAAPLVAGCVLFGLGFGNLTSLPPLIAQRDFRPADVGTVVALVTAINQAVFALAPAALGWLREQSGDYALSFLVAAAAQVTAAGILMLSASRHAPSGDDGNGRSPARTDRT